MKKILTLIGPLAVLLAAMGCAWAIPDAAPLVIYRREGIGKNGGLFSVLMWQLTVDINGKITVIGNTETALLRTTPKVDVVSSESMTELHRTLDSVEMQSLCPEQLLERSRKIKTPEYTYTLLYGGRVLQTVSGAVPPEMMPALRLLDQKLQMMDSQATAPGVDQFGTTQQATVTPTRLSPTPVAPTKPGARATATPMR